MPKIPDIVDWAQSSYGFFVDRHWQDGRWVLEPGPIRLACHHRAILRHIFGPGPDGKLPYEQVAWLEPAKSGKSTLAGLVALYTALHLERNSQVIMAANTQNQAASLMYRSLTDAIDLSPHLGTVEPRQYEVSFRNGNQVKAIASNSKGAAGSRFSLFCVDELWAYTTTDAQRLFSEHKIDPTRLVCMKFATGYGGYLEESSLWLDALDQGKRGSPVPELEHITNPDGSPACWANGRAFTFWSKACRQPWQTDQWIEERRKSLRPPEFTRMILCEFAESEANFTDQDHWLTLIDPDHKPLPAGSPQPIFVGMDLATKPGGDDAAVIGCYEEDGKLKVAWHKVWKGGKGRKQDLKLSQTVQPYLLQKATDYHLAGIYYDPFQALKLADDLRSAGLRCVEIAQSHATRGPRDTHLWELVANSQLVLYDHPDLRTMAGGAITKELPSGMLFLQKAGGRARIDLLVALSCCAYDAMPYLQPWKTIPFLAITEGGVIGEKEEEETEWQKLCRIHNMDPRTGVGRPRPGNRFRAFP